MMQSFTVRNFRCLKNLTIEPLQRLNLIAGKNNTGKTALLEALFVHAAPNNPEVPLRLSVFRGIEQFLSDPDELWGWLFYGKDTDRVIELKSKSAGRDSVMVKIRLIDATRLPVKVSKSGKSNVRLGVSSTTAPSTKELILEYVAGPNKAVRSRALVTVDGMRFDRAKLPPLPTGIFLTTTARHPSENVTRFSKLAEERRQEGLLRALECIEPRLDRLEVLVSGGGPMIHGDVEIGRLIPLPFMGDGISRLLSILLAITDARNGVVLVDEIENGLHYSSLKAVWTAIAEASREANAQVFATTHSWECIRAAHEAFSEARTYDFCLHRLDRTDNDISSTAYDQEMLEGALGMGLEVR